MGTEMRWIAWILFGVLWFFGYGSMFAHAHWDGPTDPKISAWFSAQHNSQGQWCCDNSDGHAFYEAYKFDPNGDVEFDSDGKHYHLPAYMVLNSPNPTGSAVWWFMDVGDGSRVSYCFAPGSAG